MSALLCRRPPSISRCCSRRSTTSCAAQQGREESRSGPGGAVGSSHHREQCGSSLEWVRDRARRDGARHADTDAARNFELRQQSLEDRLAQNNKPLEQAKTEHDELATALAGDGANAASNFAVLGSSMVACERGLESRRRWQRHFHCYRCKEVFDSFWTVQLTGIVC